MFYLNKLELRNPATMETKKEPRAVFYGAHVFRCRHARVPFHFRPTSEFIHWLIYRAKSSCTIEYSGDVGLVGVVNVGNSSRNEKDIRYLMFLRTVSLVKG